MIIYSKSFPGGQIYRFDGPEDALNARSESGWIDSEFFLVWLEKIFLKFVVPECPVYLLTDGINHILILMLLMYAVKITSYFSSYHPTPHIHCNHLMWRCLRHIKIVLLSV